MLYAAPANAGRVSLLTVVMVCAAALANAQTVPAPWKTTDIGAPTLSGSASQSSGVFTVTGAGSDIGGTSDQFTFVYQQVAGDVDIVARIDDLDGPGTYAKAGVMIRRSLSASAGHVFSHATVGAGIRALRRASDGGKTLASSGSTSPAPMWVRATRKGSQVTTSWSSNGTAWTTMSTDTITFGSSLYVGVAVNSRSASTRATAAFSNVKVTGATAAGALPAGQQSRDLGSPAVAGSVGYASGSYTIKAAGADIWDVADQFHFVYQPVTGNVEVVARVASITRAHDWSKAGVMVRESLTAASRHATMFASAGKGYAFQRRPQTGEYSTHTSGGTGTAPGWVRLVRTGDLFEAYRSANGTTWTKVGSDTIPMGATVYVGLAVTSHNTSTATTAVLDAVKITATASGNQPPAVSITAPANGTTVTAPATVTISATASDPENRLASVDFYAGSTLIVRDTTAPYSASWSASTAGSYSLTAVAHDADGASTTSGAVSVTVSGSGSTTTAPSAVAFTASSDHAGNVTSYLLQVFTAGANPNTATPVASSNLGKPAPDGSSTITVDRRTFFSGLAAGSYVATVTAIGPGGQTQSGSVAFTR